MADKIKNTVQAASRTGCRRSRQDRRLAIPYAGKSIMKSARRRNLAYLLAVLPRRRHLKGLFPLRSTSITAKDAESVRRVPPKGNHHDRRKAITRRSR